MVVCADSRASSIALLCFGKGNDVVEAQFNVVQDEEKRQKRVLCTSDTGMGPRNFGLVAKHRTSKVDLPRDTEVTRGGDTAVATRR
ncbi:MAG: hypothetical protein CMH65_02330 [Nevskiales bacterium]|nr:hypothetical protein [Nevskiales bacterium]